MRLKKYLYLILFLLLGCGGSSGSGGETPDPPPPPPAPTKALLKTPAQNSECLDGENVDFSWDASQNTDSYTIVVKNLLTGSQVSQLYPSQTLQIMTMTKKRKMLEVEMRLLFLLQLQTKILQHWWQQ
jgi:hypothetical protein